MVNLYNKLVALIKAYPAVVASLLSVVVLVATRIGLHVTVTELTAIASALAVVIGLVVHGITTGQRRKAVREARKAVVK